MHIHIYICIHSVYYTITLLLRDIVIMITITTTWHNVDGHSQAELCSLGGGAFWQRFAINAGHVKAETARERCAVKRLLYRLMHLSCASRARAITSDCTCMSEEKRGFLKLALTLKNPNPAHLPFLLLRVSKCKHDSLWTCCDRWTMPGPASQAHQVHV